MKWFAAAALIFCGFCINLSAAPDLAFRVGVGEIYAANAVNKGENPWIIGGNILTLGIEEGTTGLGLEYTPFAFINVQTGDTYESQPITFLNFKLYWNCAGSERFFSLRPFASVNWLNNGANLPPLWKFGASFRMEMDKRSMFNWIFFNLEAGYALRGGQGHPYLQVGFDLTTVGLLFLGIVSASAED
ncbi:MAG: hypothetical protein LBR47_02210 [Spirochaetaceae bacterium]|jgi:hypothetical protein|nr:hypothetical protein [Spirochaetaceae bacterium]